MKWKPDDYPLPVYRITKWEGRLQSPRDTSWALILWRPKGCQLASLRRPRSVTPMSHLVLEGGAEERWGWCTMLICPCPKALLLTTWVHEALEALCKSCFSHNPSKDLNALSEWASITCLLYISPPSGLNIHWQNCQHYWKGITKFTGDSFHFFFPDKTIWRATIHYLVTVFPEVQSLWTEMGKYILWSWISVSSSIDFAQKPGLAVSYVLVQICLNAAPDIMQRRHPKSKQRNPTANVLLLCMKEGQELQYCYMWGCFGALCLTLSLGKMIYFLLKLFWYQVAVTWVSLILNLWVGNQGGGQTCFSLSREKVCTVELCSELNKRSSAHVVFISDAPLKCLQALGL